MDTGVSFDKVKEEIEQCKDFQRGNLLIFTRQAFSKLPKMSSPHILDIGCGSGVPAIELAGLSGGRVTAVDIDQYQLDRLLYKIQVLNLSGSVEVVNRSLFDLGKGGETYDIVWAEGSIDVIGFDKGLCEWRNLLKLPGYLAVHDVAGYIEEKLRQIRNNSYRLIDYFILEPDVWWDKYYVGLEKKLGDIRQLHGDNAAIFALLEKEQAEIDDFRLHPELNRSVFFIMQKNGC